MVAAFEALPEYFRARTNTPSLRRRVRLALRCRCDSPAECTRDHNHGDDEREHLEELTRNPEVANRDVEELKTGPQRPGETEQEFQTLLDFVAEMRFDRVGAFMFSFEPGTSSEPLGDPVPPEVKQERYERLMQLQQGISLEKNQTFVGGSLDVLIEGSGDGISLGRSYRDAPEIDGMVIIEGELPEGQMASVRITGAMSYDLSGCPNMID